MKGLLLKDWYMIRKYCKAYLVIALVFIMITFAGNGNMFFTFYPCLLCGMIPVNLLAYDERSRWIQYSETIPYTRTQIVSGKYIIGLSLQVIMLVAVGTAQVIRRIIDGNLTVGEIVAINLLILAVSTLTSSISLPFVFKLGVEKGRISYYVMIGFACGASAFVSGLITNQPVAEIKPDLILVIFAVIGVVVYILSWRLSVMFYKKREL